MIRLLLITGDPGLQVAFGAMAASREDLSLEVADAEEALAVAKSGACNVVIVDDDSIAETADLAGALTLVQAAPVAILTGPELTAPRREQVLQAGADVVMAKPAGTSSPTLAGRDGPAFADWLAGLVEAVR